jgi:hypothetical protein
MPSFAWHRPVPRPPDCFRGKATSDSVCFGIRPSVVRSQAASNPWDEGAPYSKRPGMKGTFTLTYGVKVPFMRRGASAGEIAPRG